MAIPAEVLSLNERFERNREDYHSANYNEARLRLEFLDPFFEALGWDIQNKQDYAEAYKDVITEDSLIVEATAKAPDYCFRIGGQRKFFVEAKKPAVNIHEDTKPAYQLRRYAWSAKLPLSILTDFEEFAVYDTRIKPEKDDKASTARVKFIKYTEYEERWDEIADIFSRDAILKGSFDKYAQTARLKRGTALVDDAFLVEIESWREMLARNIALRNTAIGQRELNFSVQATIDRIIFLRICEGRGIETYGALMALQNGKDVYPRLMKLFHDADFRYNSGLFHFERETGRDEPDNITPRLAIDDRVLKDIIKRLYYPDSPYEFAMIPADILGQVYERFLGKVIRLTPGGQAKVEEKPEVRKAGGVYYTPTYIVDYIVRHTVGKLVEGKKPKAIKKMRVLDPACGSGSFLLVAYQFLLDWYLDQYKNGDLEQLLKKRKGPVFKDSHGELRLTPSERKRILIDHIYGVDIDSQAVEVTKLSLLLKVLEGENQEAIKNQLVLLHERALPDLDDNIKCGNSLIGPDFYANAQMMLLTDDEQYRINVFDWKEEFAEVFKGDNPGFDAVIGNPPYVFGRDWKALNIPKEIKSYLGENYHSSPYQLDMFSIFMEKGITIARSDGYVGMIVPNVWLSNSYSSITRKFILSSSNDLQIAVPIIPVFPTLTVDTIVFVLRKSNKSSLSFRIIRIDQDKNESPVAEWPTCEFIDGLKPISTVTDSFNQNLLDKILRDSCPLSEFATITRGVHSYRVGGYGQSAFGSGPQTQRDVAERPYHSKIKKDDYRPFIYGKDLQRFTPPTAHEYVYYGAWLAEPRDSSFFEGLRIYSRKILSARLLVTLEESNSVADQQVYISKPKPSSINTKYLAGLMASKLIAFFIKSYYDELNDAFPQIKISQLKALPIRPIDFSNPTDRKRHDRMVDLVDHMLDLHKKLQSAKTPHEKETLQRQIDATDQQIDRLVYELYDLTEEEIRIVEGEARQ